jgi:endogenous inhibitor of DNA gyrase (YacG/DUF329 family)
MKHEVKKQIKRLRTEGYGYGRIADLLHMPESTVKSFCRRNGLGGRAKAKQSIDDEIHICKWCGLPVRQDPKRKEKKFCSYDCRMKWWGMHRDQLDLKAVYHFECAYCHKQFTAYGNNHRKYCCHECYIADRFGGGEHNEKKT